jgi:hypothetical protein
VIQSRLWSSMSARRRKVTTERTTQPCATALDSPATSRSRPASPSAASGIGPRGTDTAGASRPSRPTKARITKEPIHADQSDVSRDLRDDPRLTAPIFIGHVRFASRGEVSLKNTHPFTRRINGSDFVFAHNGTLSMEQSVRPALGGPWTKIIRQMVSTSGRSHRAG